MAFLEPGIRDTCEWARLIPEETVGEPGEGTQAGRTVSSVRTAAALDSRPPSLLLSVSSLSLGPGSVCKPRVSIIP